MSNQEIINFIQLLEKDYPNFKPTNEEYQVWKDILSKIGYEIARVKYQNHKDNKDFNKYPPKPTYFTFEKQAKVMEKYMRYCNYCNKLMYNEACDLHEDRHRSVNYIKKRKQEVWNKETTYQEELELLEMNQKEFDKKYLEFLKILYKRITNRQEKRNIENIVYLEEHPEETITPTEYVVG